ncbi:hypothetical protein ANCDUO_23319 [Ancylostoma duodenale]|uniref:Uncharacterized protein n=1 Tax=Ancylostoma duodenale TaxID=51022 RepID=A0A0C2FDK1_9BILA|nr:hypothetical protein ANCDUO_23319 [Ancylostoma duodenale]
MDIIATTVDDFPRRLKKCNEASGGDFEQHYLQQYIDIEKPRGLRGSFPLLISPKWANFLIDIQDIV